MNDTSTSACEINSVVYCEISLISRNILGTNILLNIIINNFNKSFAGMVCGREYASQSHDFKFSPILGKTL